MASGIYKVKFHDSVKFLFQIMRQPEITRLPYKTKEILVALLYGIAMFDSKSDDDDDYNTLVTTKTTKTHNIVFPLSNKLTSSEYSMEKNAKFSPQMVYHQVQLSNCQMGRLLGSARKT